MKNKKGFTLIELLCVISILAIVSVIASANVVKATNQNKEKLYCTKLEVIKDVAYTYGFKHEKELQNSSDFYEGYKSLKITINDLIKEGFLEEKDVLNPLDNSSLKDKEVIIYLKNSQIYTFIANSIC